MLDRILKIEEQLIRVEALLLVISVLLMLGLATYNVFYRNVLVPIQVSLLTEDEPTTNTPTEPTKADEPSPPTDEAEVPADDGAGFGGGFGDEADDESGGFGGGFGDDEPAQDEAKPATEEPADDSAGFGGGFGGDADDGAEPEPEPEAEPEPSDDGADGFGGGFGGDDEAGSDESGGFGGGFGSDDPAGGDEESGGFGGGFGSDDSAGNEPAGTQPAETASGPPAEPKEVPWFAKFVDTVKLEWIDVLLRQLVLVVGFLGAMLAAQRRKHITIDALSKVLPMKVNLWVAVFTSALSTFICVLLAKAGADLVKISIEFPKELVSWADEWQFQLAFPIGFGLLALHFAIRVVESFYYATGNAEPPEDYLEGGAV